MTHRSWLQLDTHVAGLARHRARAWVAGLCACFALCACKADTTVPATQVVVTVNSDLTIGEQLARVDVEVRDAAGKHIAEQRTFELSARAPRDGQVRVPFSFTVAKGKADRFRLDVIGYGPLGIGGALRPVIERKAIASFRPRETLLLKVFLGDVCFDNVCAGERTCYPDASGSTAAGDCGSAAEAELTKVEPGAEQDAWTGTPGHSNDAGPRDGGSTTDDGGKPSMGGHSGGGGSGGNGGNGDRDAGERDAGGDAQSGGGGGDGEGGSSGSAASGGAGGSSGTGGTGGSDPEPTCVPVGERMFNHTMDSPPHLDAPEPPGFYNSSPPSSGQHCNVWGQWAEFTPQNPLPACNFVHNLEHGAIALLYNCPDGCDEIVKLLRQVMKDAGPDPDCSTQSIKRLLITPYGDMAVKVAAAAWGYTWTSDCIDGSTHDQLLAFINAHWGSNPNSGAGEAPEPFNCPAGSYAP